MAESNSAVLLSKFVFGSMTSSYTGWIAVNKFSKESIMTTWTEISEAARREELLQLIAEQGMDMLESGDGLPSMLDGLFIGSAR